MIFNKRDSKDQKEKAAPSIEDLMLQMKRANTEPAAEIAKELEIKSENLPNIVPPAVPEPEVKQENKNGEVIKDQEIAIQIENPNNVQGNANEKASEIKI